MPEESLINKQDFPRPLKFAHYIHPVLGAVCIDEYCDTGTKTSEPHAHPREQQSYG